MSTERQMDLFSSMDPLEVHQLQRIIDLEHHQNNLRRGLFQRYNSHEKQLQELRQTLYRILTIMEEENELEKI